MLSKIQMLGIIASMLLVATSAMASPVPELDPGSASLGAALLVGGWLVISGPRRRR